MYMSTNNFDKILSGASDWNLYLIQLSIKESVLYISYFIIPLLESMFAVD